MISKPKQTPTEQAAQSSIHAPHGQQLICTVSIQWPNPHYVIGEPEDDLLSSKYLELIKDGLLSLL